VYFELSKVSLKVFIFKTCPSRSDQLTKVMRFHIIWPLEHLANQCWPLC